MKFELPKRENPNVEKYSRVELDIAYRFSSEIYRELGAFLKGVVIFGSTARKTRAPDGDIDVLVVIDDISLAMTPEVIEAYRVIVKKVIVKVSTKLHVITLRFTAFWEYIRQGDPVGINILRDGVPIIDSGFFEPMQALLKRGKIRPSEESVWTYYVRAPNTLHNSKWHIAQATLDLYWAVVDAAHAALMVIGEVPPTPEHVADILEEKLVKPKLLDKKYVNIMRQFYKLMKMITHNEIKEIKGEEFDRYYREAEDFVQRMRRIIEAGKKV